MFFEWFHTLHCSSEVYNMACHLLLEKFDAEIDISLCTTSFRLEIITDSDRYLSPKYAHVKQKSSLFPIQLPYVPYHTVSIVFVTRNRCSGAVYFFEIPN